MRGREWAESRAQVNAVIGRRASALGRMVEYYVGDNQGSMCDRTSTRRTPAYVSMDALVAAGMLLVGGAVMAVAVLVAERFIG